jgi:hypothetical protein
VRVGFRTLVSLALCAAAAGAALAHLAIDVLGDYALAHDSYDDFAHGSRILATLVALAVAALLAARGLRVCCEVGARNRTRLARPGFGSPAALGYAATAVASSCAVVPAMEWVDGRVDGLAVTTLGDAFGGSLVLGLLTTVLCAALVAGLVFAFARWLISRHDTIVALIATLLRRNEDSLRPSAGDLGRLRLNFRPCAPHALRLSKRGPPAPLPV